MTWNFSQFGALLRFRLVEGLLKILPTVAFDLDCARIHARLWARLEEQGNLIGAHDLMIAATCVHEGDTIATLNEKEFSRIVALQLAAPNPAVRSC